MESDLIIFRDNLEGFGTSEFEGYLVQALCIEGECSISFNNTLLPFKAGDMIVVRRSELVNKCNESADFKVETIYIKVSFYDLCLPRTNSGSRGQMILYQNPILHLTSQQFETIYLDFRLIKCRISKPHHFELDMLMNSVQMLLLDFYNLLVDENKEVDEISNQSSIIMNKFIQMLEEKEYRNSREVSYFAGKLFITPKYLSEISKQISGYPANYWINNFTIRDIGNLLKDRSIPFSSIADMFNFSSKAYFTRYVQRYLGMSPKDFRN